jgi:hypothetical protein
MSANHYIAIFNINLYAGMNALHSTICNSKNPHLSYRNNRTTGHCINIHWGKGGDILYFAE